MALPLNKVVSSQPVFSTFLPPDNHVRFGAGLLEDFEYGGVALNDASQGLRVKIWRCWTDGTSIYIQPQDEGVAAITAHTSAGGITECSLSFDVNMNYAICWMESGVMKFKWYDTTITAYTITIYEAGEYSPRLCLDDKRLNQVSIADILLFYIRGGKIWVRAQRDRYTEEYEWANLPTGATGDILACGMNTGYRVQLQMRGLGTDSAPDPEQPPTDPGIPDIPDVVDPPPAPAPPGSPSPPAPPRNPQTRVQPRNPSGSFSDIYFGRYYQAKPASPGLPFQGQMSIANYQSGITTPIPPGVTFSWGFSLVGYIAAGNVLNGTTTQTYTTSASMTSEEVLIQIRNLINAQSLFASRGLTATLSSGVAGPYLALTAPAGPEVWWVNSGPGEYGFCAVISAGQQATFALSGPLVELIDTFGYDGIPWQEGERIEVSYGAPAYGDATIIGEYTVTAGDLASPDPILTLRRAVRDLVVADPNFVAVTTLDPVYVELLNYFDDTTRDANIASLTAAIAQGTCFSPINTSINTSWSRVIVRIPLA